MKRCAHIDKRFVVEIRREFGRPFVVDYGECLPNGEVVVEGGDPQTEEQVTELWDDMTNRMIGGQAPRSELR